MVLDIAVNFLNCLKRYSEGFHTVTISYLPVHSDSKIVSHNVLPFGLLQVYRPRNKLSKTQMQETKKKIKKQIKKLEQISNTKHSAHTGASLTLALDLLRKNSPK